MKAPIFVRSLSEAERQELEASLRSPEAFVLKRAQYLLASARGLKPIEIATTYGGSVQNVRNIVHAFNQQGLASLTRQSCRPKSAQPELTDRHLEQLQHILHQSPRAFGKP